MRHFARIVPVVVLLLAFIPRDSRAVEPDWYLYQNQQEEFSLCLPSELQAGVRKKIDAEAAEANRMPVDYVNFRPAEKGWQPFEFGVGVHLNSDGLSPRAFADRKDERFRESGGRLVMVRSAEAVVAGLTGVRDEFKVEKNNGWISYARIVLPYKKKFLVLQCTLGSDKPIPRLEKVFREIVDSFELIEPRDAVFDRLRD